MKRVCADVDVCDIMVIEPFVMKCILKHIKEPKFKFLLTKVLGVQELWYKTACVSDRPALIIYDEVHDFVIDIANSIRKRTLHFLPPVIRIKMDRSTDKLRYIGDESAAQECVDYIAVEASKEMWRRRIVLQQVSSVKGRGPLFGIKMIQKYIIQDNKNAWYCKKHHIPYIMKTKYFVKLDIRKCYPSTDKNIVWKLLNENIKNPDLLFVWYTILQSYEEAIVAKRPKEKYTGLLIGGLPAQWLMQMMLSYIYRYAKSLHSFNGKKAIEHMVMFMDDIWMCGSDRLLLQKAIDMITKYTKEVLHLDIKNNWHIEELGGEGNSHIDMMGYVVYRNGKIGIRPKIFLRARRMVMRVSKGGTMKQYKRLISFKGYFDHSNCYKIKKQSTFYTNFKIASTAVSIETKERNKYESLLWSGKTGQN